MKKKPPKGMMEMTESTQPMAKKPAAKKPAVKKGFSFFKKKGK